MSGLSYQSADRDLPSAGAAPLFEFSPRYGEVPADGATLSGLLVGMDGLGRSEAAAQRHRDKGRSQRLRGQSTSPKQCHMSALFEVLILCVYVRF
jgi:hypothetical protein